MSQQPRAIKCLELFAGCGGLALGLGDAGFSHVLLVERDHAAGLTLGGHFGQGRVRVDDVQNLDYSEVEGVDLISGGPPCQPFSLGGRHGGRHDRRDMFPEAVRCIRELKPKSFVFENVKGLLRSSFSDYFSYILRQLSFPSEAQRRGENWSCHSARLGKMKGTAADYQVYVQLVNAADHGVPQHRERVVIVGFRVDTGIAWGGLPSSHSEERLLWNKYVSGDYWEKHRVPKRLRARPQKFDEKSIRTLREIHGEGGPDSAAWVTVADALMGLPDPRLRHGIEDHLFRPGAKMYPGHSGSYVDSPSKTIKAGGHGVPGGENMIRFRDGSVRYFTVLESKRIQTFPDSFRVCGSWGESMRQIGNAVPVLLGRKLGEGIFEALSRGRFSGGRGAVGGWGS